jgi:thiopeptide-type bacteriocin biosynthesis protein
MYVPIEAFLLRAPLLPERALTRARAALEEHPLGAAAVALASPRAAAAVDSTARRRTFDRYGRRAAFRPTPAGLLAGVCVGELGPRTSVATGVPAAHLSPTWQRMASLGRALLDDPEVRARVRLRVAPSLVCSPTTARWLGPGNPLTTLHQADLDTGLAAVLDAAAGWTAWPAVRRAYRKFARTVDDLDLDELLLLMVDQGLLHADLTPPLIGPPPAAWMCQRLEDLPRAADIATLGQALASLSKVDLPAGFESLRTLPGASDAAAVNGVLVHQPRRPPVLARTVVERAAALAPLLFRMQDALAPPAAERLTQPALDGALQVTTELFGAGALDLGAFAAGDYGVVPADDEEDAKPLSPPALPSPALLTVLVDAITEAATARRTEAHLSAPALASALGAGDTDVESELGPAPPATCELYLGPTRPPRGAREGTGWLLGLHAPAGSSWGRFAAALGPALQQALRALALVEREARPGHETLDVAFAPSPALADLCTHPRARRRALALSSWPDERDRGERDLDPGELRPRDLGPGDLELVADPAAPAPLSLRARGGGGPLEPSPLSRVRSTTAPAGGTRLLCGWSLHRQHAPWALALGPLAGLAHVPRLVLEGFVIAPASWRLPAALGSRTGRPSRARVLTLLRRWRRATRVPRRVQVGHEDQLLMVDLDAPDAVADLEGHDRVWEIWPPLGGTIDRDGRRVEAVVALVDRPDPDESDALCHAVNLTREARSIPPPRTAPPLPGWRTIKLFGAPEHQDALLLYTVLPTVKAAMRAGEITRWFFLRYIDAAMEDGVRQRPHLRVRTQAATPRARTAFESRLQAALAPARQAGAVATVEWAEYYPERARYGAALPAVHDVFQSDSFASCALLAEEEAPDGPERITQLVRSLDALTTGLGLDLRARESLARARRDAAWRPATPRDSARADADAEFRLRSRELRQVLSKPTRTLRAHAARTARALAGVSRALRLEVAPALLHVACVRLGGPTPDLERTAYTFWQRTLEGLDRSSRRA